MTRISKKSSKFLAIISLIICFAFCITLADFFSNLITINAFNSSTTTIAKSGNYSVYAISLHSSETKSSATEYASTITKQSGAGYIWNQEGKYFVLASAYLEENDAKLVKTNLENSNNNLTPTILKIEIGEISINGDYSANEITAINNTLNGFKFAYSTLYDISISYDTSLKDENECKLLITELESELNKIKLNFEALINKKLTTNTIYLKLTFSSLCDEITKLINFKSSTYQTFSSKIKATYIEAIKLNCELKDNIV